MKKAFRALTERKLLRLLKKPKSTLILFHRKPDADALGSALALAELLTQMGSSVLCTCPSPLPERLAFLLPKEEDSTLSALLPTAPVVAFGKEEIPAGFLPERILSVDSASPTQLGDLYPLYEGKITCMIDHHASGTPYADHYILPDAAATGEILFDLAKKLKKAKKIHFTQSLCDSLYAAISSDTGGFRFANTTPATHRRAAELIELGARASEINHNLFDSKSKKQLLAESAAAANLETYLDGKISVVPFPFELKKTLDLADEHLETLVDIARSLEGAKIELAVRQPTEDKTFWVSARSSCDFDVASLCENFGGGGHKRAAGCNFAAESMKDAIEKLISKIDPDKLN